MATTTLPPLAIVTGTSAGIGHHIAAQLLERGWEVIGLARRPASITHARYRHLTADLADGAALDRLIASQLEPLFKDPARPRLAVVNNAAAIGRLGPLERLTSATLGALHQVNLVAPVALMAAASRAVPRTTALRVVNVSSGAAMAPFPGLGHYCAAKAALRMAGMVMAEEWKSDAPHAPTRRNAGIMSYEPGVVDTEMQTEARSHDPAEFPWVGVFESFKTSGMLVPADRPARDVVDFLAADQVEPFKDGRLGG